MDEQILKELVEVNLHLRSLEAEIQKLVSVLLRAEAARATTSSATSFQKRS